MGKNKKEERLTFHEYQLEINRLEAKAARQDTTLARTKKLLESLRDLQELHNRP